MVKLICGSSYDGIPAPSLCNLFSVTLIIVATSGISHIHIFRPDHLVQIYIMALMKSKQL